VLALPFILSRSTFFCNEFASRPLNGLELLIKVVVTLQNIVNSANSSSKISNLLTRTNSSTNRKRKAAVGYFFDALAPASSSSLSFLLKHAAQQRLPSLALPGCASTHNRSSKFF